MRKRKNDVVMEDWLSVSTDGFASMNAGRDPAHLVKELVQNALDALGEQPGTVQLTLAALAQPSRMLITCIDDGKGMENLRDIRTVFHTTKTDSHLQRGRMGRGFKEMLCLAQWAVVESGLQKVEFGIEARRRLTRQHVIDGPPIRGMRVSMQMPWPAERISQLQAYFQSFLPPGQVRLVVNGSIIAPRPVSHRVEASLPTELLESGRWIRPVRKTLIELVPALEGEAPTVYELGIPVCPIEWTAAYHANVLQRVPMNPCRDAVASGYLQKLHRVCLQVLLPEMPDEQAREDWVGTAAPHCTQEVQKVLIERAFGSNIARSVPKMGARQFDEDARDLGVQVIDLRQTCGGFRQVLKDHVPTTKELVDQHDRQRFEAAAATSFDLPHWQEAEGQVVQRRRRLIELAGGMERITRVMEFARWFCQGLLADYGDAAVCSVTVALLEPVGAVATWNQRDVLTLGLDTPWLWTHPMGQQSLSVLIHEVAHHQNAHHGRDFHQELESLAGRACRLMLLEAEQIRLRFGQLLA